MKALMFLLIFIYGTVTHDFIENTPNGGTVLFSYTDAHKRHWKKTDIGLLRARRYFQYLLPPPQILDTCVEDFVDTLLSYFTNAYTSIKREASDDLSDHIMTTALSDTLGGYLKTYVLPISKLGYYGGTVSLNNAIRVHRFYEELKKYLDTDGSGWRSPDEYLLDSVKIRIAQPHHESGTRSISDPCQELNFEEKTEYFQDTPTNIFDESLPEKSLISLPHINWNKHSQTMLLPLKNKSLVSLTSPESSDALLNYYYTAKDCLHSTYPDVEPEFDYRFQSWLVQDVVPHLNDDQLYPALGKVLTILNKTKEFCNKVINFSRKALEQDESTYEDFSTHTTSKKMLVLYVILILEVAWCIPALLYMICIRRKRKNKSSNVYLFVDSYKDGDSSKKSQHPFREYIKLYKKPRKKHGSCERGYQISQETVPVKNLETRFIQTPSMKSIGTEVHVYTSTKDCLTEIFSIVKENNIVQTKPSLRKIKSGRIKVSTAEQLKSQQFLLNQNPQCYNNCNVLQSKTGSCSHTGIKPSSTVTLIRECQCLSAINTVVNDKSNTSLERNKASFVSLAKTETIAKFENKKASIDKSLQIRPNNDIPPHRSHSHPGNQTNSKCSIKDHSHSVILVQELKKSTEETELNVHSFPSKIKLNTIPQQSVPCDCQACMSDHACCYQNDDKSQNLDNLKRKSDYGTKYKRHGKLKNKADERREKQTPLVVESKTNTVYSHKKTEDKSIKVSIEEEKKNCKKHRLEYTTAKPYMEIKIDRPHTEINVGIESTGVKNVRTSKIPKRKGKECISVARTVPAQTPRSQVKSKNKSMIPLPVKRALDDIVIKSNKATSKDSRLNVTL